MARKKDTPQKAALREMMGNYMKENNVKVKDGTDVNSIMRDMMSIILEGALDQELVEELGYSKYEYHNKETDNSRGSVKNFVALVKNDSFLVRITDMTILIEKEFIYGSSKRPNPTDY